MAAILAPLAGLHADSVVDRYKGGTDHLSAAGESALTQASPGGSTYPTLASALIEQSPLDDKPVAGPAGRDRSAGTVIEERALGDECVGLRRVQQPVHDVAAAAFTELKRDALSPPRLRLPDAA